MSSVPKILPTRLLPLAMLDEAEWNPTQNNERSLDLLKENIKQVGFVENLVVIPVEGGRYRIISGHDKSRAARALKMSEVPCTVLPSDASEELQKLLTVRMNTIKKRMNPQKFLRLYEEMATKYSARLIDEMMMFTDQDAMADMIRAARQSLPEASRKQLDAKAGQISSVNDLTAVVSEIFNRMGTQLDRGFAVFSFGGQEHVYFEMDSALRSKIMSIVDRSDVQNRHVSEILKEELGIETE